MIRSMTGYGAATVEREPGTVAAEIRSVNGRHLNVSLRLPEAAQAWEAELRALVGERVSRGSVQVNVSVRHGETDRPGWELDEDRVRGWLQAFETLRDRYALPGTVDLSMLVRAGGILRERSAPDADWLRREDVEGALTGALAALVDMREREGERLDEALREQVSAIRDRLRRVEERAPLRLERERERLQAAVEELTGGVDLEPGRLERELALLADKWDIGEETVRARAHLDAFVEYLDGPAADPVGKRLSFLVQELHREINTMGAKANDADISRHVVEAKNGLEKLREQVENVE